MGGGRGVYPARTVSQAVRAAGPQRACEEGGIVPMLQGRGKAARLRGKYVQPQARQKCSVDTSVVIVPVIVTATQLLLAELIP